ncbi:MAG: tail fiber domain-containing protein, partial [Planctomycetes bacterium]|nr:tail fiber domain-containing protein [Planctomycetota bacterium]
SMTFSSDPDTGIYWSGDALYISMGGARVFRTFAGGFFPSGDDVLISDAKIQLDVDKPLVWGQFGWDTPYSYLYNQGFAKGQLGLFAAAGGDAKFMVYSDASDIINDPTNFERIFMTVSAGNGTLGLESDGTGLDGDLIFSLGNVERMRIDSAGNVGLGTASPSANLHVVGNFLLDNGSQTSGYVLTSDTAGVGTWTNVNTLVTSSPWTVSAGNAWLTALGNVGVGTAAPAARLHVVGDSIFAGNILPSGNNSYDLGKLDQAFRGIYAVDVTILSDERLKKDILPLGAGLGEVMKLRPVSYRMKSGDERTRMGLIAQEVEVVLENAVKTGSDPAHTMGVQYTELIPVLIKAVQQQQEIISTQTERIEKMEKQNGELYQRMRSLEKDRVD